MLDGCLESVAPLGVRLSGSVRDVLFGDWIDVFENPGKRSGAYSAPVYGVHPYMLLNYNDTLDAVFTLAHEMGHSMHTCCRTSTSRSSTRATRSSSPRCRRR